MKKIFKVAIAGGTCSGKTSCKGYIEKAFENTGVNLIFIPEAATVLCSEGKDTRETKGILYFQNDVFEKQLEMEKEYAKEAENADEGIFLIICDRGIVDTYAYLEKGDADKIAAAHSFTKEQLLKRYDAVIHLVTAADGAIEFYKVEGPRTESPDEAIALDRKTKKAWEDHPRQIIIDNSGDFNNKMERLIKALREIVFLEKA